LLLPHNGSAGVFPVSEGKMKTGSPDVRADCSARPVWVSKRLYELIRKIRKEKGGNISSVVEELIERGIRCRNISETYNMQCGSCLLTMHEDISRDEGK
jgi:hypothetical protein